MFSICLLSLAICASTAFAQDHWQLICEVEFPCQTIYFTSPSVGWAGNIFSRPAPNYVLYKTTDGGYSWHGVIPWDPQLGPHRVTFYDACHGFLASCGKAAITVDGENWTPFYLPSGICVDEAVYLDSLHLIGTSTMFWGEDSSRRQLSFSNDGGWTWESQYVGLSGDKDFHELTVSPSGTLLVSGGTGEIWRSTDHGQSWQVIEDLPVSYVDAIAVADTSVFYLTCSGSYIQAPRIARSVDGGQSWGVVWTDTLHPGPFFYTDAVFTDRRHGWIAGDSSFMLRTTDGGETWNTMTLPDSSEVFAGWRLSTLHWAGVSNRGCLQQAASSIGALQETALLAHGTRPPPSNFRIASVYPNPFNASTTISLHLTQPTWISATIYDLLGRPVDVLADRLPLNGDSQLTWKGSNHATGIYFLRVTDGTFTVTTKLCLLR